jgi:glyoxylase-like metal-dependent hydrolase (beta-lactamase superfamily II)
MKKSVRALLGIVMAAITAFVFEAAATSTVLPVSRAAAGKRIEFPTKVAAPGTFPQKWIHGSESLMDNKDPVVQVHWYNEHTVMMRENKAYADGANFFFLYFGNDRAFLLDQGSITQRDISPVRELVDDVIAQWCRRHGKEDVELIVANTHLHGDHYSAWNQFQDRPNTRLVGLTHEERLAFFGMTNFPEQRVEYDLGGRKLILWGSPGHDDAEMATYDTYTHLICTGDMLYWGLITIRGFSNKWAPSIDRLVKFTEEYPVSNLINCHIEMSNRNVDYPRSTSYQPDEPPMQISVETLRELNAFVKTVKNPKDGEVYYFDRIWLYNQKGGWETVEKNKWVY